MIKVDYRGFEKTVVVFSGLAPKNRIFEWMNSFKDFPCNIIGVNDPYNCWYQRDKELIRDLLIINLGIYKELICLGGSAGGFAALWFGKRLKADKIIVFCPQSACGEEKRKLGDNRWLNFCLSTPSFDIKDEYPQAIVHYDENEELDLRHVERLRKCKFINHKSGGHDIPNMLKKDGRLKIILAEEILS